MMGIGRKLLSVFVLAFAMVVFDTGAGAQEAPKADKPDAAKRDGMRRNLMERRMRGQRGERGMRGRHGRKGRGGMHGRRGGMRRGPGMMFRGLNLTDAQKMQVQALMEKQRMGGQSNAEEMRKLMMARRSGLLTKAQEARIAEMQNQRKAAGEQFKQSFLGILNPEQRKKVEEREAHHKKMMEAHKMRMEEHKKRMEEHKKRMEERRKQMENETTPING